MSRVLVMICVDEHCDQHQHMIFLSCSCMCGSGGSGGSSSSMYSMLHEFWGE